jgi:signal peptidase
MRLYVVHTGSMTPTYRSGDIVVDRPVASTPRPGEVLTFRHSDRTTDVVTHRLVALQPDGLLTTKGDANPSDDAWSIRPSQVEGQVVVGLRYAGYLAVYLQQPAGIASLATTVLAVILLWQIFFSSAGRLEPA